MSKGKARRKTSAGRPPIITATVVEKVCELMALGLPEEYACAHEGVNPATFGPAVSRSEAFKAIKRRHDASFMAESLRVIASGGEKIEVKGANGEMHETFRPWQGRAWLLERRHKPHFNRTDTVAPSGRDGGALSEREMLELETMAKALFVGAADKPN